MFRFLVSLRQTRTTGVALLWAAACLVRAETPTPSAPPPVRNLILMIGDGMGPLHVRVTSDFAGKPLILQSPPVQGSLTTFAANNAVTDSAAAGTALACGQKTDNGVLGQLPDGTKLVSIAEQARDAGKRVGILSSVPANHATPASFYAHAPSRNSYYEIGLQAFASRFDVLGGTSLSDEQGKNVTPRPGTTLWQEAEKAGYKLVRTPADLKACAPGLGRLLVVPERLHSEAGVPYGRTFNPEKDITLAQMTAKALELLDNPGGFFLMVEDGAIDQASHANDVVRMIAETLAFDEAITVAKVFADAHPDTLIVVTADHETGGLALLDGYVPEAARAVLSKQRASASKTSDDLKRCIAEAKQADDGTIGWTAARNVLATALGIKEDDCVPLERDYQAVLKAPDGEAGKALDTLMRGAAKIRDTAAGLAWTTGDHTATNVPLWAFGPGSERFAGVQDNTQVFAHGKALLLPPAP